MKLRRSVLCTLAALLAAQADAQAPAPAPKPEGEKSTTEEVQTVVVTARRIEERLIDVPLTIRALTAGELQDRGITSISELAQFTPGLSYSTDFGRTAERPVVRGISALRPEAPQPVSVFVDGLYMRDGVLGLMLDDATQVEVIKGPQSALYGRSTYAGAINYITVKPGNEFKGTAQIGAGQFRENSLFAALTVPLIDRRLSMRVKGRHYEYGGQYTNTQTGNRIGDERTNAGGVVVSYTPNDRFDARLSFDHSRDRDGFFNATVRPVPTQSGGVVTSQNGSSNVANGATCNGRTINIVGNNAAGLPDANVPPSAAARLNGWPCGAAVFSGTLVTRNERDLLNYVDPVTGIGYGNIAGIDRVIERVGLVANYDFGGGYTLTWQSGFTEQRSNVGADQSYNGTQFAITGTSWTSYDRDILDYRSHELRLVSPQDRALTWLLGGFVYDEKTSGQSTGVIRRSGTAIVPDNLRPKSATETRNVAPFGRVQYQVNKALRVSFEGRQNRETIKVGGTALGTAVVTAGTCVAGQVCFIKGERTFSDFSPRFTIDYKPARDTLLYAQLARGSKAGGFNLTAGLPSDRFSFNGEKVTAAELGVKAGLLDNRVALNAALFRNNIKELQLSNISTVTNPFTGTPTTTTIVNNVGKARTQGFEIDVWMRVNRWVQVNANYAYTDAKATEGTEVTNGTVFGGNQSVAGFELPRSPKHSAAASVALEQPREGNSVRAFARVDVVYQSRRYAEIQNLIWADPYTRVNASAGFRARNWTATLWVKNATDDDTSLNGFRYLDPVTFRRTAVDFLPKLRQIGLTAKIDF
jgi:outer membrane receptor protein involved in Fe transport